MTATEIVMEGIGFIEIVMGGIGFVLYVLFVVILCAALIKAKKQGYRGPPKGPKK